MTRVHVEERPSKDQVARDLAAWQHLAVSAPDFDISAAQSQLRGKLRATFTEQDLLAERRDMATQAVRRLQELTRPLNQGLKELYSGTEVDSSTDELTRNILKTHLSLGDRVERVFRWHRCTVVAPLDAPMTVALKMSRCVELFDDGTLRLHLMVDVGLQGAMGSDFNWHPEPREAAVGSIEADRILEVGVMEMIDALKQGIKVLVERLPDVPG